MRLLFNLLWFVVGSLLMDLGWWLVRIVMGSRHRRHSLGPGLVGEWAVR